MALSNTQPELNIMEGEFARYYSNKALIHPNPLETDPIFPVEIAGL
jgi:hypothetical protein